VRIALLLAVAAALASSAAAAAPFTPKTLAGTWNGTWKNETFGWPGPRRSPRSRFAGNTKLLFGVNFGGSVFGCPSVPRESTPALPKGRGANHWSPAGFAIKGASKDFGALTLTYKSATGSLTGSGSNPPCQPGLSWTIAGKFAGKTSNGKVNIKLASGQTAVSDISLTRS
jgi:hypothetical protein